MVPKKRVGDIPTGCQLPVTSYQLPVTSYQLLLLLLSTINNSAKRIQNWG